MRNLIGDIPVEWDAFDCILEMMEVDYHWKQMEWWGFYLEYKIRKFLQDDFLITGRDKIPFDLKRDIDWDIKGTISDGKTGSVLLNDTVEMADSIKENGFHGNIIAFFTPEYDTDGSFKEWHDSLKGEKSKFVLEREERTDRSRVRKKKVTLNKIIVVMYDLNDLPNLEIMRQGRNANGKPRKPKYSLNIKDLDKFRYEIIGDFK